MTRLFATYTYVLSLAISLFAAAPAQAQDLKKLIEGEDSVALFRGVSVSYDVAGTIMRMVGDYGQYEGAVRVNLRDKYFPVVEFGLGDAKHNEDPATGVTTKTSAPFFRLGCDFNVAKNKHDDYRVLFGARYGFSSFSQEASGTITDPFWGGTTEYLAKTKGSFHWAELVFGVDAKIAGPVRMGWTVRYKKKITSSADDGQQLWYVPGFGKNGNVLGGTFNVAIEL